MSSYNKQTARCQTVYDFIEWASAAGGCRMWPYLSVNDAVTDVLRLSQAMSYKNALAGLPLGRKNEFIN